MAEELRPLGGGIGCDHLLSGGQPGIRELNFSQRKGMSPLLLHTFWTYLTYLPRTG